MQRITAILSLLTAMVWGSTAIGAPTKENVEQLRASLGIAPDVPGQPERFTYEMDQRGVIGLWSMHDIGLGEHGQNPLDVDAADRAFRRFASKNAALLGVSGKLALRNPRLTETPPEVIRTGKRIQLLSYDQVVDGFTGEHVRATFVDGTLVSFSGRLVADKSLPVKVDIPQASATATARATVSHGAAFEAFGFTNAFYSVEHDAVLYRVNTRPAISGDDSVPRSMFHLVNADTGEVVLSQNAGDKYPDIDDPETPFSYIIGFTYNGDAHPLQWNQLQTTVAAIQDIYTGWYYPWSNTYTTPVAAFRQDCPGGIQCYPTVFLSSANVPPTGDVLAFGQNHILAWVRHSAWLAEGAWGWAQLYHPWADDQVLFAIPNKADVGAAGQFWQYCPWDTIADALEPAPCLSTRPIVDNFGSMIPCPTAWYGGDSCPSGFGIYMHEFGHHANSRIVWPSDRSYYGCEGQAVEEAVSSMYAQNGVVQTYGMAPGSFGRYEGWHAVPPFGPSTGSLNALGSGKAVHTNASNISCYDDGASCDPWNPTPLTYANSVLQAHWEVIHEVNCGSGTCVAYVADESISPELDARYASGYATWATPVSGSLRTLVANYLLHFYNAIGYTAWNSRWWTFNHHNLVGPKPGYSPC